MGQSAAHAERDPIEALYWSLTNHAPDDPATIDRFDEIRGDAKLLGRDILELCPASRERSLAITHLEEAVMWATKSIACNQDRLPPRPG